MTRGRLTRRDLTVFSHVLLIVMWTLVVAGYAFVGAREVDPSFVLGKIQGTLAACYVFWMSWRAWTRTSSRKRGG